MRRASRSARQPEDAADLDELAVDRQDRAGDAEIDREEDADRDQRHLRGLEDAEPQDEQRHPGDRRDRAQRLQGRIEQAARRLATCPESAPSSDAARRRRGAKPTSTRHSVAQACVQSSPVCGERHTASPTIRLGGGISRPCARPDAHGRLPAERERERQDEAQSTRQSMHALAAARGAARAAAASARPARFARSAGRGAVRHRDAQRQSVAVAR